MNKRFTSTCLVVAIGYLLNACNVYRYVPQHDYLYKGGKVVFENKETKKKYSTLQKELKGLLRPMPNKKIVGIPVALALYSSTAPPNGKGLRYLFQDVLGQPPVLLSQVNEEGLQSRLTNKLRNDGFLQAVVFDSSYRTDTSITKNKRDAHSLFFIRPGVQFIIDSVQIPNDSTGFWKAVHETFNKTLLQKGKPFTLELAIAERERIDTILRNRGFFYFSPDQLLIRADTSRSGLVNVSIVEKSSIPIESKRSYKIGKITIFSNYNAGKFTALNENTSVRQKGFIQIDPNKKFKPNIFSENVLLEQGEVYRYSDHEKTLKRLINLNQFKFINAFFKPADSSDTAPLDVSLLLTPYARKSLQFEVGSFSKSTNFIGSEIKLKTLNRNLFHGAERLEFNFSAGFEKQVGGTNIIGRNNTTQSLSLDFYVPRLWLPFKLSIPKENFIPLTIISLGIEFIQKQDLFTLRSSLFKYGYLWKKKENRETLLNPFVVNLVQPIYISPEFQETLNNDPNLQRSFEKQFIFGAEYSYRLNNQDDHNKRWYFSNTLSVDLSGNLTGLFASKANDSIGTKQIFNTPISQFIQLSNDFRLYIEKDQSKFSWVNRLFFGYGYAYGNNQAMPLVKQYFVGGSSSIRAFRNGVLGPGTYRDTAQQIQANSAGDIKIEFNTELRYKLMKYISLASFIDVGNIWLRKENNQKPGSGFSPNWWRQLAMGAGAGLRIDASVMVIRFDVAFALQKPWLPQGQRWVVKQIDFSDPLWRKDNLVLNIAIGYPF